MGGHRGPQRNCEAQNKRSQGICEITKEWCRGGELNSLRRPFQGRALPVSYPGTYVAKRLYGRGGEKSMRQELKFSLKLHAPNFIRTK